ADGKILWIKTNSYFDAATEEEKANPAYKDAAAITERLNELNASFSAGPVPQAKQDEKVGLENAIYAKMKEVDKTKYKLRERSDVGYSGFTPICDGENIYIWLGTGVSACYD